MKKAGKENLRIKCQTLGFPQLQFCEYHFLALYQNFLHRGLQVPHLFHMQKHIHVLIFLMQHENRQGSFDNGFRPEFIFGAPNSYRFQRVFGELHLEGFNVNFTKKGIQWDENLDIFLKLLKDDISSKEFPLLQQAENYRQRATENEYKRTAAKALEQTVNDLQERAPKAIEEVAQIPPVVNEPETELIETDKTIHKEFTAHFNNCDWIISIELSFDPALTELVEVGNHLIPNPKNNTSIRQVGIRLSLTHPFMVQFAGADNSKIEPVLRIIAAFGLAEVIAKNSGARTQGEIRRNFNELISKISNSQTE